MKKINVPKNWVRADYVRVRKVNGKRVVEIKRNPAKRKRSNPPYGGYALAQYQYREQQRELARQDRKMRKYEKLAAARYRKEESRRKKEEKRVSAMLRKQAAKDRKAFSRNPARRKTTTRRKR